VQRNLLQGVHRSNIQLFLEDIVQREKENQGRKAQEGKWKKDSRKGILEFLIKSSGKDSFLRGEEQSQTVRVGEVVRRRTMKYFGTLEDRQVGKSMKNES
jgi:hypothetical protein